MRQIGRELSGPHSSPLLLAFTNKTLEILKCKSKGGRPRLPVGRQVRDFYNNFTIFSQSPPPTNKQTKSMKLLIIHSSTTYSSSLLTI